MNDVSSQWVGLRDVPGFRAWHRTTTTALHGRDPELAVLREALGDLRLGDGRGRRDRGQRRGSGRPAWLAEAVRMAGRMSARVGVGEADPSEAVVELAPLLRALFDGAAPLLERSALPTERSGSEQRYWLLQDLESLLEGAAAEAPVLVCLDDLQWADSGTLAALRASHPGSNRSRSRGSWPPARSSPAASWTIWSSSWHREAHGGSSSGRSGPMRSPNSPRRS